MTASIEFDRRKKPRAEGGRILTFWQRVLSLVLYSDTTPTRFMLAMAATFWAIFLAWPGDTFDRPVYVYMKGVAPEWAWTILWAVHAAGMWWRTFSSTPARFSALAINFLGVVLFCGAAVSIYLSLTYPLPAAMASDAIFALASLWVLVRTHVNNEHGWRID